MAKKNGNILIVDDNRGVLTALQLLLKPYFEGIITLPSPVTLPSVLRERSWQVVLLDMNFTSGCLPPMPTLTLPYGESRKEPQTSS